MAWKERTVEQMREEFVRRVLAQERSKAALCKEYDISRPTGDKWIERFQEGESLSDRSRAPLTVPGRTPAEIEAEIVRIRHRLKRSPGGGHGNPFQYSCLENPMDRGARWAAVYGLDRVRHD